MDGSRTLEGRVIVLTGAARGIGRATAARLSEAGAHLLLVDSGVEPDGGGGGAEPVEALAGALPGVAIADAGDVSAPGAADRLVRRAIDELGGLHGAVACAGIRRDRPLLHLDDEDLERVLAVHVRARFALARATARALVDRRQAGSIVVMTSPAGFFGAARQSTLAAGAAATAALTRSAAVELRRHGIRVNAIAPTARTRLTESSPLFQGVAEGSMGPHHVAPVVEFLLSDLSAAISGEVIGVAGGRVYTLGGRESSGAFASEGVFSAEELAERWTEVVRSGAGS